MKRFTNYSVLILVIVVASAFGFVVAKNIYSDDGKKLKLTAEAQAQAKKQADAGPVEWSPTKPYPTRDVY